MKKCCVCKMRVPPRIKKCPVCQTEYTRYEYFKMNWLNKVILLIIAAIVLFNLIGVIALNREIRSLIKNSDENPEALARVEEKYNNLNPVLKHFVHYSEVENINENIGTHHIVTLGDESVQATVYSQYGSTTGAYQGELLGEQPDGLGKFTFLDKNGQECTYEGEFVEGKIQGTGEMRLASGEVQKGGFFEGELNGYGVKYNSDGTLREKGVFVNNTLNGTGAIYGQGSLIYEGVFEYGLPEKNKFIQVSSAVGIDELLANTGKYVNKPIAVTGILTYGYIGEDQKQYYIFSQKDNENQRFLLDYSGKKTSFALWSKYTVYGCYVKDESITDNLGKTTNGVRIKGFYAEKE